MNKLFTSLAVGAAAVAVAAGYPTGAEAQYYKGKTIEFIVGFNSGGTDNAARTIARRLQKYIPGAPKVVVKNMPGGILDVEFVAQFLILLHSNAHPGLRHANTASALNALRKAGCLGNEDADTLLRAATLWQTIQALLRLTGAARDLTDGPPASLHPLLCRATKRPDIRVLEADMQELAGAVRAIYQRAVAETAASATTAESGPLPSHALDTARGD